MITSPIFLRGVFRFAGRGFWLACAAIAFAGCGVKVLSTPSAGKADWIVFASRMSLDGKFTTTTTAASNIWVVRSDGARLRAITSDNDAAIITTGPVFGPSGEIYFRSTGDYDGANGGATTGYNLWVYRKSSGLSRLTSYSGTNLSVERFAVSSAGIIFTTRGDLNGSWTDPALSATNLWYMKLDASGRIPLTSHTAAGFSVGAIAWTGDATRVLFSGILPLDGAVNGAKPNATNIFSILPDGTGFASLTGLTVNGVASSVTSGSSDGRIYYGSTRTFDGANTTKLSRSYPWSMAVDGTDHRALATYGQAAVWTMDGTRAGQLIGLQSRDYKGGGNASTDPRQIWAYDTVAQTETQLTRFPVSHTYGADKPIFIENDSKIVFIGRLALSGDWNETETAVTNLWVMNSDGSNPIPLTQNTAGSNVEGMPSGDAALRGVSAFFY